MTPPFLLFLVLALGALSWATLGLGDEAGGTIEGKLAGKKRYRKDAVVYVAGPTTPPPADKIVFSQKNQQFVPRVLPIVKGTTVSFANEDNTEHNVFSPDGETYNLGKWGKGGVRDYTFKTEGVYTQLCKVHPSMLGYIVALPNKYFAKVEADGSFAIKGVPPGTYDLKVWQESGGHEAVKVTVVAADTAKVTIKVEKKRKK